MADYCYKYKSWSGLRAQLEERLCDSLKGRITYFLTRYHEVHNAYGRASVRLDGNELVCLSWAELYEQETDAGKAYLSCAAQNISFAGAEKELQRKWQQEGTLSEYDFLDAATSFLQMGIKEALESDSYLLRVFAIMDSRVGKRTLKKIRDSGDYLQYPDWVRQFYELRLNEIAEKST